MLTLLKAVPRRRHRGRGFDQWTGKKGVPHCAETGQWQCYRLRLKYQMRSLHQRSILPTAAYYAENYSAYRIKYFCEKLPGTMVSHCGFFLANCKDVYICYRLQVSALAQVLMSLAGTCVSLQPSWDIQD